MLQIERLEKIKEFLVKKEYANINELAEYIDVSTSTIRRYLKKLEYDKIIEITRGGATLAKKGNIYEHPYLVKRQMHLEEKKRIAAEAISYINENQSVYLDSSSTVYEMTKILNKFNNLMVSTNDVLIASALSNSDYLTVTVVGGTLRRHYYTLTGYFSDLILKDLYFDVSFIGVDTISLKGGLMITNIEEIPIKRRVINSSKKVIVLCDHSKFEQQSFLNICSFDKVNLIITGKELSDDIY